MNATIQFRPDESALSEFTRMVQALGVTSSDFARRAYDIGKSIAFNQLAEEKKREALSTLERLGNACENGIALKDAGSLVVKAADSTPLRDSPSSNLGVAAASPEARAIVAAASGKLSLLKPVPPAPVRPPKPVTYREKRPKKLVE